MTKTVECDRCGVEIEIKSDHAEVSERAWEEHCKSARAEEPRECGSFTDAENNLPVETH